MANNKSREYLDITGLQKFWAGAKEYIDSKISESTGNIGALAERVDEIAVVRNGQPEAIVTSQPGSVAGGTGEMVTIDLSAYAKKADFTSVMSFEGPKTADQLADLADPSKEGHLTTADKGKVFLATTTAGVYVDGSEYVWTGSSFEPIGPGFDLSGYYTSAEVNTKLANEYYTNTDTDTLLGAKADQDDFDVLEGRVDDLETDLDTEGIPEEIINGLFT